MYASNTGPSTHTPFFQQWHARDGPDPDAAAAGQLVLSAMHANNCAESLDRIINMFPREQYNQIFLDLSRTCAPSWRSAW